MPDSVAPRSQNAMSDSSFRSRTKSSVDWLLDSAIQVTTGTDCGGAHAWLDEETRRGAYLYSESTGYLITLLSNLVEVIEEPRLLGRAQNAGDWLIRVGQHESGLLLGRKYACPGSDSFSFEGGRVALFDNCVAGYGLLNLYRITASEKYLRHAVKIAERCADVFFNDDSSLLGPVFDLKAHRIQAQEDRWSLHNGSFLLKCALFLVSVAALTGNTRFKKLIDPLLRLATGRQLPNGAFRTDRAADRTHLHPHGYTIEGLLFLAFEWQRDDLFEAAKNAIDFSFRECLDPLAGVRHSWPTPDNYCGARLRSDVIAQHLRAYYIAKILDESCLTQWEDRIDDLHSLLDGFALDSGGTSYGLSESGSLIRHANSWCHFFRIETELYRHCHQNRLGFPGARLVIT